MNTYRDILNAQYVVKYVTDVHQTYNDIALWDRDKRFTFWDEKGKVKVVME